MNLFQDLKSSRLMYLKAALFLLAGIISVAALLFESPTARTALLLAVAIWSFCRLYYFLFYVIEHYIEPGYRFDGVLSAVAFLIRRRH